MTRTSRLVLASVMVFLTAGISSAQTTSTASEVKKFEVIAVDGNDLVVRLPEGTRQINVPPGFVFTVNGKPLSVGDLIPGMSGTATITTTTTVTPVTVTEVKSGTVALVSGTAVYVRTPEGVRLFTQSELDKRGVKIFVDGKPRAVSELHGAGPDRECEHARCIRCERCRIVCACRSATVRIDWRFYLFGTGRPGPVARSRLQNRVPDSWRRVVRCPDCQDLHGKQDRSQQRDGDGRFG